MEPQEWETGYDICLFSAVLHFERELQSRFILEILFIIFMSPLLNRATYTNHFVRDLSVRPSTCFPIVTFTLFGHTSLSKLRPLIYVFLMIYFPYSGYFALEYNSM